MSISTKKMGKIVKDSYENNYYHFAYRKYRKLTCFEREALEYFLAILNVRSPHILDLGCGTGVPYGQFLIKKKCIITGIDCSEKHLNMALSNIPQANLICADLLNCEFPSVFNGAIMLYSLFHVPRIFHMKVLKKIYRHLSKEGKILLNVREGDSDGVKYKEDFCGKPMCWSHYSYKAFKVMADSVGYKVETLGDEINFGSSESHIWLILKK